MKARSGQPGQEQDFTQLVKASMIPCSRRDFMRVSAVLAGAAASGIHGVSAARSSQTSGSTPQDVETDVQLTLPFNPYGQPVTVDPHRTVNWGPFWVMMPYAWSGLLRFDENGAVELDLAESIEPNEDGSVWTATLKDGIAYANGDPIVADHFITSWQRALDRMRLSPMAQFMSNVAGYDDVIAGNGGQLAVKATDERTLEITLSAPVSHFPASLATFVWAVMNPAYIDPDEGDEPDLATASAGPWKITLFDETSQIVMEPNEHHWDSRSPSISSLVWAVLPGGDTDQAALNLFEQGELAVADLPSSLSTTVQQDEALASNIVEIEDHSSTLAISMDFHQPPFDDVRVRRAIAGSIDRETWANDIQEGAYVPANSFTPPVLKTIANYDTPTDPKVDKNNVQELLNDAEIDPENMETIITYFQPATDSIEQMDRTQKLLEMIEDATDIEILHDTSLTNEQITALRQDNGGLQFDIVQWWLASNTPSILELVASQESDFNAGWINWEPGLEDTGEFSPGEDATTFNDLVTEADAELDEAARNDLYSQAEELLLENAVYIPLGHWVQRFLQQPWLQGTRQGPWSGGIPIRIDKDVIVSGQPGTPVS